MKIIEFFTSPNPSHWISQIEKSDWGAGQYLAQLLRENRLQEMVGENALLLMLTEGEQLISYCTYAPLDDIQPTELSPWVGFVYTFPEFRGHRYMGKLLDYALCLASIMEKKAVYISTGHTGLYEKYGFSFYRMEKDIEGEDSRVYRKLLDSTDPEHTDRMARGNAYKAEIVAKAREGIDPVAYCGFSCDHCFLGQWCGGCKSSFNCCSFGTLFEKGKCPNKTCAQSKGLDGCYGCDVVEQCKTGFYAEGNDGTNDCKAQAIFVKKYGKEALFWVHDRLHQQYDFQKIQEILSGDVQKSLEILETYLKD